MSQSGFTPVLIYASGTTGNSPSAANLTSSSQGAELALNYFDGKLFYKDASGNVQVLATKGTGPIGGSNTQIQYNSSGALAGSANLTFDGTNLAIGGSPVSSKGQLQVGTIGYTDTGVLAGFASSVAGYNQIILQNTNSGATASTNFNVSNDQGSATTNYGEFGINSSGFSGSGFSTAGWTYLASASTDLAIGTYGSNPIHFIVNSGTTDAMTILSSGNVGIGTSSPAAKLQVGDGTASITSVVAGSNSGTGGGAYTAVKNGSTFVAALGNYSSILGGAYSASPMLYFNAGLQFYDANAGLERMRIDTSGNVGIGTSSISPIGSGYTTIALQGGNGGNLQLGTSALKGQLWFNSDLYIDSSTGAQIFRTGSAERMRLDSSGNLGIGTTPSEKLTVYAASGYIANSLYSGTHNIRMYANGGDIGFQCTTSGDPMVFQTNGGSGSTERMRINSSGQVSIGTTSASGAGVTLAQDAYYWTTYSGYSGWRFGQYQGGFYWNNGTDRMILDSNGNLLVGKTTTADTTAGWTLGAGSGNVGLASGQYFIVDQTAGGSGYTLVDFRSAGTEKGSISYNGTNVLYNGTSDQRLKENIVDSGTALATIDQIKIRAFDWIESKVHETHGVIAQELQQVAPQCVTEGTTNEDGSMGRPWQVDTSPLIPMLIKSIQELNATITDLQAKLKSAGVAGF